MKTHRKSKFDLKAARASLKIMQSIFAESKQLKQITKEVNYHISYVSKTMKRLKKSGLITRDSITKLYYVPVKSLVREYAEESGVFEDEEIDSLIQLINMKRDEISKADFNKKLLKKARHIRVYPSILFLSLLNLADFDPKDKRYGYYFKFTLTLQGIAGREYIKQFFTTIFDDDTIPIDLDNLVKDLLQCWFLIFETRVIEGLGIKKIRPALALITEEEG